jgi:hypothetical protein
MIFSLETCAEGHGEPEIPPQGRRQINKQKYSGGFAAAGGYRG